MTPAPASHEDTLEACVKGSIRELNPYMHDTDIERWASHIAIELRDCGFIKDW